MAADKELSGDELQQVDRHLAECTSCRRRLDEHGALDMLLKNHFSHEPPEGYFETLWPNVSERAEEGPSGGGGGNEQDQELVFKSSPAMDFLKIPERRPSPRQSAPAAASEAQAAPEPQGSPWRWPVALIVSTAIVVVGYLAYQKMNPPPAPVAAAAPIDEPAPEPAAAAPVAAADAGMQVAALTPTGDGGSGAVGEPTEDNNDGQDKAETSAGHSRAGARHARRSHHHRTRREHGAKEDKPQPAPAAPAATAKGKPAPAKKPVSSGGKNTALDNLLDDAIGGAQTPAAKPKKEAAKDPAADLPEQLNMNQIRTAMNRVKGRVAACYDQFQVEGMANVGFSILGSGHIKDVEIRGKFRGTDTGDCVVKAVKGARFPKFRGKPMTIKNYPFLLQ